MNRKLLSLLISLFFFILLMNIGIVFASSDDEVDLTHLPDQLATMLGIPLFASQILVSACSLMMITLLFAMFKVKTIAIVIIIYLWMAFLVAIGWLAPWLLIMEALIVMVLFASNINKWIGG
jgi:hypothetical protein